MAIIPQGSIEPIRSKKELALLLRGAGVLIGFVSILALLLMLYAKSYKNSKELFIVAGIPGAISLISLILSVILERKGKSIFSARRQTRKTF
jgi:hypothetical protein